MTYEQFLQTAERVGVPTLWLIGAVFVFIRYIWPFLTEKAFPWFVGLVESGRKERIEQQSAFQAALKEVVERNTTTIQRLLEERDAERDLFLESLSKRDDKIFEAREAYMRSLKNFEPVIDAIKALGEAVKDLHKFTDERTTSITVSIAQMLAQIDTIRNQLRS